MKLENTKAQMRKGVLDYCILLVLEKKPLCVSNIMQNLEKSKMIDVEGIVLSKLIGLKNEGYLGYSWEESPLCQPRKFYKLTERGLQLLSELKHSWNEMDAAVKLATQSD